MRAARFYTAGNVRVDEVAAPRGAPGPHDVLVRNRLCGICGTDMHEYRDGPVYTSREPHPVSGASLPQILGHEYSGVVEAIGAEVTNVRVGDRVAVMPQVYCGRCEACLTGRQQSCADGVAVGYTWPWGGFAEYSVVPDLQVSPLPDDLSDAAGALVEPAAVAVHAVASAPVRAGDAVLVTGGGPIGQLVALASVALGAGTVVLSEPNNGRRARAAVLDTGVVVDPVNGDLAAVVADASAGRGADVAIECSGSLPGLDACLTQVRTGGTVVQTALQARPVEIDVSAHLTVRDVALKGVYCYPVTSWPRVIRLMASGRMPAERVVTGRVLLDDISEQGFKALLDPEGDHVKILVEA